MVVEKPCSVRNERALLWRIFLWASMVAAISWTLVYQAGKSDPDLPEFVYVNF
jgi:hypothetical protein